MSIGFNKIKLYSYMYCNSTRVFETSWVHWIEQKQFIYTVQKVLQWFHYASWCIINKLK